MEFTGGGTLKTLAVIPARGGSKRLPGKNLRVLGGKPLVDWTLEAAVHSGCFFDIVLTSDADAILERGKKHGVSLHARPDRLATDHAKTVDVLRNVVDERDPAEKYDALCLLQPTTPFRSAEDIRNSFAMLERGDCDSVVSISRFQVPPQISVAVSEGYLLPLFPNNPFSDWVQRTQDFSEAFHPNGGIYLVRREMFIETHSLFGGRVKGYVMPSTPDVDTMEDFEYANFLLKRRDHEAA